MYLMAAHAIPVQRCGCRRCSTRTQELAFGHAPTTTTSKACCGAPGVSIGSSCDVLEQAVLDHYVTVSFSDEFKAAVRARLDEAVAYDLGSTQAIRGRLEARLAALDTKENNLLDLAADGDLPKDKIKGRLMAVHDERAGIKRDIGRLEAELDTGRAVFLLALDLLDQPQELYRQAGPQVGNC